MRKNIVFETEYKNKYLYTESSQYSILLHPILNSLVVSDATQNSEWDGNDEKDYYVRKFNFLSEHGILQHTEISFLTKPDPEKVKVKLANLRQLLFEVTDGCNLKCHYCGYGELYNNYDERHSNKLSFEKVKHTIDYMVDLWKSAYNMSYNNVVDISFYGGEPTLNMDLIKKTISYLDEKKVAGLVFTYRMTTNTMLLDLYMDYLVEKEFNLLISLDGYEYSNSYRETKGGKNSFSKVYKNACLLRDTYPDYFDKHVEFNAVLHDRNNYEAVYLFIKNNFNKTPLISELNDKGLRSDKIEEFKRMYRDITEGQRELYEKNDITGVDEDIFIKAENSEFRSLLHGYTGNMYKSLNDLLRNRIETSRIPSGTCMAFNKKFFLTVNGKVLPCEKVGQENPLGFVTEDGVSIDFEQISSFYDEMYIPLLKLCKQCYHHDNCAQCVFNIYDKSKSGKLTCPTFVNKSIMADFLKQNISYIEKNPAIYEEMIKKDILG